MVENGNGPKAAVYHYYGICPPTSGNPGEITKLNTRCIQSHSTMMGLTLEVLQIFISRPGPWRDLDLKGKGIYAVVVTAVKICPLYRLSF